MNAAMQTFTEYVTVTVGGQLFGLPISRVQDVFVPGPATVVPLASPEIAGLLNVRGRILTLIDMWRRLEVVAHPGKGRNLAVGVEHKGESYGLLIEQIGEVLNLPAACLNGGSLNLPQSLARVSAGIHRMKDKLMVVLDLDRVLDPEPGGKAGMAFR
jgi:purine-binding chemotaxis protein CheW